MNLTIISHTEHFRLSDGTIVGLGPTVAEINHLLEIFSTITHVAMLHDAEAPPSALPYASERVSFVALPAVGGTGFIDKMTIVFRAFTILRTIHKALVNSDYFQFRAPTGIGVFVIPYLMVHKAKKGWFKYAGNWIQENAPLAYRLQKWFLLNQKRAVTINGHWNDQPKQCITFENPCLTDFEFQEGQEFIKAKTLKPNRIELCFVGRLEEAKGLGILIEAVSQLKKELQASIKTIHIVGDGKLRDTYETLAESSDALFHFHGFLSRSEVHTIYKRAHAIVLPSASEGFPKVIAEAMNYGCLPIVSNVSSLSHYIINGDNGFLLDPIESKELSSVLETFLKMSQIDYSKMICSRLNSLQKFTYRYYNERIKTELLKKNG